MKRSTLFVPTMLATALLAACGSGGSNYGMVQSNPPPPTPPPPVSTEPCSGTMTTDCTVAPNQSEPVLAMTGGRTSDHALIKQGNGTLSLDSGTFVFGGGTQLQEGYLWVNFDVTLQSNVSVAANTTLGIFGSVVGDVAVDDGANAYLWGSVTGNVDNAGFLIADLPTGTEVGVSGSGYSA